MEAENASSATADVEGAVAVEGAAAGPAMRRAITTGALPDREGHQAGLSDGEGGLTGAELSRGTSEPQGREIAILREKIKKSIGEKQMVFLKDMHLGPKDDTYGLIQVREARVRARVDRLKDAKRIKLDEAADDEKLNLTFRMMLGVRVSVGRLANPFLLDNLQPDDFKQQDKYVFPPAGAAGRLATPSHKLNKTFKFRDYAPKVFKKLRATFGIDEASYMNSVAGDYKYLELITNSKSGSFFFYSHDHKYIIKNMKRAEARFFRRILPQYYEHHHNHPNSVLIRFCGMYLVKSKHKKIPFIVMKCIDGAAQKTIHTMYDLKGSTVHRTSKEGEKVLKDNNLRAAKTTFRLGSQREAFLKTVRADAEFLRSVNVMDYSMFVSVHDKSRPPERRLQRARTEFFNFADEASDGPKAPTKRIPSTRGSGYFAAIAEETERLEAAAAAAAAGEAADPTPTGPPGTIRFRKDGGINSEGDGGPDEIYWLGVIDVLQVYTKMKHAETWYKGIGRVTNELSCVNPTLYCERFVGFMEEITQ